MQSLNAMRPIVAARGLGLAEGALMYATEYVKERRPSANDRRVPGHPLGDRQVRHRDRGRAAPDLSRRVARRPGLFAKEYVPMLSMAKYYATEVAVKASGLAVQLLGAAGYMQDHPVEQYYRDAKQLTIVEGTSQMQLDLIGQGRGAPRPLVGLRSRATRY